MKNFIYYCLCRILGHKLHPYRWPESTGIPFRYKIFNRCVWCGEMVEVGIDDEPKLREMYETKTRI